MARTPQQIPHVQSLLSSGWTALDGEGIYFKPPHMKFPVGYKLEEALARNAEFVTYKAKWLRNVQRKIAAVTDPRRTTARTKVKALRKMIDAARSLAETYGADGAHATERLILDEEVPLIERAIELFGEIY